MYSTLFKSFHCRSLNTRNRFVMAPMTRSFSPGGTPAQANADYYRRRAEGGVGLIVSEGIGIERPASRSDPNVPVFYGEAALGGWKQIIDAVHSAGGVMMPQLWHVGAFPDAAHAGKFPVALEGPSGLLKADTPTGQPMTVADIDSTLDGYARAAGLAQQLGFDGVEFHAAHGYLIDQFFWAETNRRDDRYGGGTHAQRNRFALELLGRVRQAVGNDFALSFRISQWKIQQFEARMAETPAELEQWLLPLAEAGVDLFHCSQRRFWEPEFPGSDLNFAGWVKKVTGRPTITVGSVGLSNDFLTALIQGEPSHTASLDELARRFDRGDFDLVAVGRAILADPAWATKVRDNREAELVEFSRSALASLY